MAADDYITEEEQAEALKKWIRDNWIWMVGGVLLALALMAGWQRWQAHKLQRGAAASELFHKLEDTKDEVTTDDLLKQISESYGNTPYVDHARMIVVQRAVAAGKFDRAAALLKQVVESGRDSQLRQVARLRLARVFVQMQKSDEALALLDATDATAFAAQIHEVRGDALVAKGQVDQARTEYQQAVSAGNNDPQSNASLLELKLNELGPAASAPTAPPAS